MGVPILLNNERGFCFTEPEQILGDFNVNVEKSPVMIPVSVIKSKYRNEKIFGITVHLRPFLFLLLL